MKTIVFLTFLLWPPSCPHEPLAHAQVTGETAIVRTQTQTTAPSAAVRTTVVSEKDVRDALTEYPGTILFSNVFACIFGIGLFALAWLLGTPDNSSLLNLLICLLGATLGWALGILLSPYVGEQQQFASFLQAATAFASGYVFSKFDPLLERYLKQEQLPGVSVMQRVALFLVALVLTTTIVFVNRQYYGGAIVRDVVGKVTTRLERHGSPSE